ncbi:MAG TPA: hypothetical protein VGE74_12880 [Gemmata sp.]
MSGRHECPRWRVDWEIKTWRNRDAHEIAGVVPDHVFRSQGNLLTNAGVLALWTALKGGAITAFSAANARIGVGDSNTSEAASQTDLQAASNKFRKAMDAGWPKVGTADGLADDQKIQFQATFGTSEGNFAWNEWGVFNAASAGTMLNRKVASLGTKSASETKQFTVTITIS